MKQPRHFQWKVEGKVGVITLNRPERKNPLTFESYAELGSIFRAAARDKSIKAVVVTGAGGNFCSGGDIFEIIKPLVEDILGEKVKILSGEQEAALTFLAARRWHGWGAGRIMLLDIGGGSLEIAYGEGEVGPVSVAVTDLGTGEVEVRVADTGSWRTAVPDGLGGRGVGIMELLATSFSSRSGPGGTTIEMRLPLR